MEQQHEPGRFEHLRIEGSGMNPRAEAPIAMRGRKLARQKGVVLFFALIALVAMTLAALAMVRSVDTANLVAGNIALKQGATQEADRVMNTAFACLDSGGALLAVSLNNNNATCNYFASLQPDVNRPFGFPDVLDTIAGTTDAATGNTSAFIIERMCNAAGAFDAATCVDSPFGKTPQMGSTSGSDPLAAPQALYRISVRVVGPRNVVAYSQMVLNASR